MNQEQKDHYFMEKALQEAKVAFEKDEVPVGAIIVSNDKIIARSHNLTETLNDVTAHAEMQAITSAANYIGGKYLNDCTMYVTLEPCHHHGNTPPCVDAIIKNRFSRVVIATKDPNPLVNEKSISKLRDNGIEVETGVCEDDAKELNKPFFHKYKFSKPYIRLKVGVSMMEK